MELMGPVREEQYNMEIFSHAILIDDDILYDIQFKLIVGVDGFNLNNIEKTRRRCRDHEGENETFCMSCSSVWYRHVYVYECISKMLTGEKLPTFCLLIPPMINEFRR